MSALSSVAALPIITTTSIANGANGYGRPDLAVRFEKLYARWKLKLEQQHLENEACDAAERAGQIFQWSDPDLVEWEAILAEMHDLVELILAQPASSLADIVLQAKACAMSRFELWTNRANEDSGDTATRLLIERICELGGTPAFPGLELSKA